MLTSKQIWENVFEGQVQQAIDFTCSERAGDTKQPERIEAIPVPRALYLDPSLASISGHQLHTAMAYERLSKALGFQHLVFHARDSSMSPRRDWQPYFLVPHHTLDFRADWEWRKHR